METIIKKAIEGGYSIQQSYYARPVVFTKLKSLNEYTATFELDDTTFIEDEFGKEKEVAVTSSHQTKPIFLDPLFWRALGKACGWKEDAEFEVPLIRYEGKEYVWHALCFHEINLTEGWQKATEYLESLLDK